MIIFAVILIASFIFLGTTNIPSFPTTTKTVTISSQTIQGSQGSAVHLNTRERTISDVAPPLWQSLLGSKAPLVFFFAVALLVAFLLAALVQRVLLGEYNFSIGPLTVPEITREEVKEATDATLAAVPPAVDHGAAEGEAEPIWATLDDPNLALAGFRIDLEREAKRIAEEFDLVINNRTPQLRRTLILLSQNDIIAREAVPGLLELLDLANRGVHGADVDRSVILVLRDEGAAILRYLRSIHRSG